MSQALPPELGEKIKRYQMLQVQYEQLQRERALVDARIKEITNVLDILSSAEEDATVYRLAGNLLVKVDKNKVVEELKEERDILILKIQKLDKQLKTVREQMEELGKELRRLQALAGQPTGKAG